MCATITSKQGKENVPSHSDEYKKRVLPCGESNPGRGGESAES